MYRPPGSSTLTCEISATSSPATRALQLIVDSISRKHAGGARRIESQFVSGRGFHRHGDQIGLARAQMYSRLIFGNDLYFEPVRMCDVLRRSSRGGRLGVFNDIYGILLLDRLIAKGDSQRDRHHNRKTVNPKQRFRLANKFAQPAQHKLRQRRVLLRSGALNWRHSYKLLTSSLP